MLEVKIKFNHILKLINQLPEAERKRLANTLNSELQPDSHQTDLKKLVLDAPTWSDVELSEFQQARQHINKSRLA